MGLTIGYQPHTAVPMLADVDAGTPQRFLWVWAPDPSVPEVAPEPFPPGVPLSATGVPGVGLAESTFAASIKARLRSEHRARSRSQASGRPLDSQRPLMLVKLSALLARLDGRSGVTEDDWSLAEVMWACSAAVQDGVLAQEAEAGKVREAEERKRYAGREGAAEAARGDVQRQLQARDEYQWAADFAAKLHADGVPVTVAAAKRGITMRRRAAWDEILGIAVANGWAVVREDEKIEPGPSAPRAKS
jgi:hypothetical protein